MDCLEAQAIISAAHDGEFVDAATLANATSHCDDCAECSAFREGLRLIDAMPAPAAPAAVIDATLAAVAASAAERASAERFEAMHRELELLAAADALPDRTDASDFVGAPEASQPDRTDADLLPVAPLPAERPAFFTRASGRIGRMSDSVKWAGMGAAGALAATALIAFLVVGTGGGTPATDSSRTASEADQLTAGSGSFGYGSKSPSAAAPSEPSNPAPATAPDYVAYEGRVYSPGALLADSSTATPTIGAVKTAFATGGAVIDAIVFKSPLQDGSIVVAGPDGYRLYTPVIRRLSSRRYQLVAGNAVERFGIWPMLPTRFTTPQSSDGAPSFTAAGTDSASVPIFASAGQPVTSGFAVAPGSAATDPAGGNPNWTWWEPID